MRISYLLQVTMHRRDSPNCTGRDKSFSFQYRGDDSGEHFNLKSTETSSITNSKALKLKCNSSDFICCLVPRSGILGQCFHHSIAWIRS